MLAFVGFGIGARGYGHDDYRDLGSSDSEAVIVLVLDHEPGENDPKARSTALS